MKSKNSSESFLWIVYNDTGIYGISFFREKYYERNIGIGYGYQNT